MTTKVVDVDNYLSMRRFTATVASACECIRPNGKRGERRQVNDMTEVKSTGLVLREARGDDDREW